MFMAVPGGLVVRATGTGADLWSCDTSRSSLQAVRSSLNALPEFANHRFASFADAEVGEDGVEKGVGGD